MLAVVTAALGRLQSCLVRGLLGNGKTNALNIQITAGCGHYCLVDFGFQCEKIRREANKTIGCIRLTLLISNILTGFAT